MPVRAFRGEAPAIHPSAFVADGAYVIGKVEVGPEASIWFGAVVRGDEDRIRIGARTNIQDGAVLHADPGFPCTIGEGCVVGHRAIVHGCTVGDHCLIGMGAVVMNGVRLGDGCVVAAGAVVPEGREFPARSLVVGVPARAVRTLSEEEVRHLVHGGARAYEELAKAYREER